MYILGVYSGVIGSTRLQELALGKCWHIDVLNEFILSYIPGLMPYHSPSLPHPNYQIFLESSAGFIIWKNSDGDEIERISIVEEGIYPESDFSNFEWSVSFRVPE